MSEPCKHGSAICEPCAYERGVRKALDTMRLFKPRWNGGCSDPECCGEMDPDFKGAWDQVVNNLEEHLKEEPQGA